VRTKVQTTLWVLDRGQFKAMLVRAAEAALKKYTFHMTQIAGLEHLTKGRKMKIARALEEMEYVKGDIICSEGDAEDSFFIITEGEVAVLKDGMEKVRIASTEDNPIIVGHKALTVQELRVNTLRVTSPSAFAMTLNRDTFETLMSKKKKKLMRDDVQKRGDGKDPLNVPVSLQDLNPLGVLGAGDFGLIELVVHCSTGDTYALKTLSKGHVVKNGMQSGVYSERDIMFMCNSPFIVKLHATYCMPQTVSFLMEAMLGGELYEIYNRHGFHGSKTHCQYYVAAVVFAFEHMHAQKILYRDLKPENILLNENGFPKLTDMGLAKVSFGRTYTACGSLGALAPEVVKGIGYDHGADWWTLGILIFELMSGSTPFQGDSPPEICNRIVAGIKKVQFDKTMEGFCEGLIKQLCHPQSARRIAMLVNGADNLKAHSWFSGFDWHGMESRKIDAPHKPQVKSKTDLSNFKADIPNVIPSETMYTSDDTAWDSEFATAPNMRQ